MPAPTWRGTGWWRFAGSDAQRILKEEFDIECSLSSTYRLLHRVKLSWLAPRPRHPQADATAQAAFPATLGLQLERVRAAQARGTRVELWFADEARIGQKNTLTRVWGQTVAAGPAAAKDPRLHLGLCVWRGLPGRG